MIKEDRPHRAIGAQIVFVGRIIAVPGHHIERALPDVGHVKLPAPFDGDHGEGTSRSSKAATGVLKSRGLARQLAPIGPRPGISNF